MPAPLFPAFALPSAVANESTTSCSLGPESVTVKVATPPSVTVTSLIATLGADSSSTMVPTPVSPTLTWPDTTVALTENCSVPSKTLSSIVVTVTVASVAPGWKVTNWPTSA